MAGMMNHVNKANFNEFGFVPFWIQHELTLSYPNLKN